MYWQTAFIEWVAQSYGYVCAAHWKKVKRMSETKLASAFLVSIRSWRENLNYGPIDDYGPFFSCSTKKVQIENHVQEIKDEVKFYSDFLKDKKKKFDMGLYALNLNEGENSIVIQTMDFNCGKGEVFGKITRFGNINGPLLVIDHKTTPFYVVCEIDTRTEGDYFIGFKKVFKGKDGRSTPDIEIANEFKFVVKNI